MSGYRIWKCEFMGDDVILVEVLNDVDIIKVQQEVSKMGYIIFETDKIFDRYFIKAKKEGF